ncbi:MAG: fibronectin type III domain-containing protein [Bacteroidota bacterium]|nr:fibronectin type III domain-containing protein [Bacteroidota bacterium]
MITSPICIIAQNCDAPTGLNVTNISNFSATLNWTLDNNVDRYRVRYKEIGSSSWLFEHNIYDDLKDISNLVSNSEYIWQVKAFCSPSSSPSSTWSVVDTFITTGFPVDCDSIVNGTAFLDSCGNCVGGTTGNIECIAFTPAVSISLSTTECGDTVDITFLTSQDPNEPDILSSVFTSDGGSFDFSSLNLNDVIGSSTIIAGGGSINVNTTLMVDAIITSDKISVKAIDNNTGQIYGTFTMENFGGGVLVDATAPLDNNNITNGNSQTILLNGLFVNPSPSVITFTSTLNSELGDQDVQNATVSIACSNTCPQLGDANCDGIVNLDDLTLVLNHWLQATAVGTNGDVIGSEDGFVNLDDLTLVVNNWLQSTP